MSIQSTKLVKLIEKSIKEIHEENADTLRIFIQGIIETDLINPSWITDESFVVNCINSLQVNNENKNNHNKKKKKKINKNKKKNREENSTSDFELLMLKLAKLHFAFVVNFKVDNEIIWGILYPFTLSRFFFLFSNIYIYKSYHIKYYYILLLI